MTNGPSNIVIMIKEFLKNEVYENWDNSTDTEASNGEFDRENLTDESDNYETDESDEETEEELQ